MNNLIITARVMQWQFGKISTDVKTIQGKPASASEKI